MHTASDARVIGNNEKGALERTFFIVPNHIPKFLFFSLDWQEFRVHPDQWEFDRQKRPTSPASATSTVACGSAIFFFHPTHFI